MRKKLDEICRRICYNRSNKEQCADAAGCPAVALYNEYERIKERVDRLWPYK